MSINDTAIAANLEDESIESKMELQTATTDADADESTTSVTTITTISATEATTPMPSVNTPVTPATVKQKEVPLVFNIPEVPNEVRGVFHKTGVVNYTALVEFVKNIKSSATEIESK